MNMALRPFSLLLLLLVMIPAITTLEAELFELETHCERLNWHCYLLETRDHTLDRTTVGLVGNGDSGGLALDTNNPNEWNVFFHFLFDNRDLNDGCKIKFHSSIVKIDIECEDIYLEKNLDKFKGLKIVPKRWSEKKSIIEFSFKAPEGQYVSDAFELYDNPEMTVGIHKKARRSHGWNIDDIVKVSQPFKPFTCKLNDMKVQPDPAAKQAELHDVSKFVCPAGFSIYLHGINTNEQIVYCSEGGWVGGTSRKMIITERAEEKQIPFCWKDTMFKESISGPAPSLSGPASSISGLESRMSGLESRMSGLESTISDLASSINRLASSISGLAPSNDTIEARL